MSLLFYRRPNYVDRMSSPMDPVEYERFIENKRKAIPPELSFEMVVANRAMPPVCITSTCVNYLAEIRKVLVTRFHGLPLARLS